MNRFSLPLGRARIKTTEERLAECKVCQQYESTPIKERFRISEYSPSHFYIDILRIEYGPNYIENKLYWEEGLTPYSSLNEARVEVLKRIDRVIALKNIPIIHTI